ncbi:hypothetical protein BGZ98_003755 [Dissophora globulifera]|nr:hypothetical protein BGZ98_003755 [Dissophora globulifera]
MDNTDLQQDHHHHHQTDALPDKCQDYRGGDGDLTNDDASVFRYTDLPMEVQLLVIQRIESVRELLQFRLVSSAMNALVLEPDFWRKLKFSKGRHQTARLNLIVAELVREQERRDVHFASQRPAFSQTTNSLSVMTSNSAQSVWGQEIEASFNAFLHRLSTHPATAQGVRDVVIESWEEESYMDDTWIILQKFNAMTSLRLLKSVLTHLTPPFPSSVVAPNSSPWQNMTQLDLTDCTRLEDLSGILDLAPCLENLSLQGCTSLRNFTPLAPSPLSPLPRTTTGYHSTGPLLYKKLNLIETHIRDHELIAILERAPHLYEIRLDQCYQLTDVSLVTLGYGNRIPPALATALDLPVTYLDRMDDSEGSTSFCQQLKILSLKDCYDLTDQGMRALVGCRQLELLIIRGLRQVRENTIEWLHSKGVPLRKALSPLGQWRYWHLEE